MAVVCPSELKPRQRIFSLAGRTIEDRRMQLGVDIIDDLLFIHGLH